MIHCFQCLRDNNYSTFRNKVINYDNDVLSKKYLEDDFWDNEKLYFGYWEKYLYDYVMSIMSIERK
jgi:hypothetical protein